MLLISKHVKNTQTEGLFSKKKERRFVEQTIVNNL